MPLVFVGIDPATDKDNCPAVFIEEETGDLVFQGWTVTDPQMLEDISQQSPIANNESVIRIPARMRAIILEAVNGHGSIVQRTDRGDDELGRAPGDAGRLHTQ